MSNYEMFLNFHVANVPFIKFNADNTINRIYFNLDIFGVNHAFQ